MPGFAIGALLIGLGTQIAPPANSALPGRALARRQVAYGLARAVDPIIITGLLGLGAAAPWGPLALVTLLSAAAVAWTTRRGGIAAQLHRKAGSG